LKEPRFDYDRSDVSERYRRARGLDERMLGLWMDALTSRVPASSVNRLLDAGCGTGRFATPLARAYCVPVIGLDPSHKMLLEAGKSSDVHYVRGTIEALPFAGEWADLVFISMAWHHLTDSQLASAELHRVQPHGGYLFIRNSTRDSIDSYFYMQFFPEARRMMEIRLPWRADIIRDVELPGYSFIEQGIVRQPRDSSPADYAERIAQRGLSDLAAIDDAAFEKGLAALRAHCAQDKTPRGLGEDVEFFIFRRL
jgi:ubiquinone/menaquinone biosynthesis C-methylase UbiE